jgi:undecaprenyl-diphosphatase
MNDYLVSFLLGIVEGVTEFLPVSSTGHLRLAEAWFHLSLTSDFWKMYTIVIQFGAILCLPVYFGGRLRAFVSTFPRGERGDRTLLTHPLSLTIAALVMTAVPAFFLKKLMRENLESLHVIGAALLVGGVVMWVVDAMHARAEAAGPGAAGSRIRTWRMDDMGLGQAVWIGACQLLSAVFPGVSRSMATIAGGQLAGMSRAAALEFSFFLSIPTMAVATGYEALKAMTGTGEQAVDVGAIDSHGWLLIAIGFVTSFVVAYGSVAWFMAWVKRHGFVPFAVYRIVLGAAVLWSLW